MAILSIFYEFVGILWGTPATYVTDLPGTFGPQWTTFGPFWAIMGRKTRIFLPKCQKALGLRRVRAFSKPSTVGVRGRAKRESRGPRWHHSPKGAFLIILKPLGALLGLIDPLWPFEWGAKLP